MVPILSPVAGFCGYLAGKMSYMKTCQEKFRRLENSPLGEALRQRTGLYQQQWVMQRPGYIPPKCWLLLVCPHFVWIVFSFFSSKGPQSELSDTDTQSFDTMFQPAEASSQVSTHTKARQGYSPDSPMQMDRSDDFSAPGTADGCCISFSKTMWGRPIYCVNVCIVQTNRSSVKTGKFQRIGWIF